jgi:uncharacterized membrane protein YidH (DUF202 family)
VVYSDEFAWLTHEMYSVLTNKLKSLSAKSAKSGDNMDKKPKKVTFLAALISIMAGAIGVQKRENMERDLNSSNPLIYMAAALLFLAIFIGSVVFVVAIVVPDI